MSMFQWVFVVVKAAGSDFELSFMLLRAMFLTDVLVNVMLYFVDSYRTDMKLIQSRKLSDVKKR